MLINVSKTLLTKEQSTWLKGLLILLIVLGHNGILMGKYEGLHKIPLNDFLYSFHVYAFFFVSSLYDWKPINRRAVLKVFKRCYTPYTVFFALTVLLYLTILGGQFLGVQNLLIAFFSGSSMLIKEVSGLSFLWFLPTMFTFSILLKFMAREGNHFLKVIVLLTAFSIWISTFCGCWEFEDSKYWSISGSWVALRSFALCLICRYLFEKYNKSKLYLLIVILGTVLSTIAYFCFYKYSRTETYLMEYAILPFLIYQFLVVWVYHQKKYNSILLYLGKHSLELYLIHLLVYVTTQHPMA